MSVRTSPYRSFVPRAVATLSLVAAVVVAVGPARAMPARDAGALRATMCRDAWAHTVRAGRVAIETRVFAFFDDGRVETAILDDTGRHQGDGTWTLSESASDVVLRLRGDLMRSGGDYALAYSDPDDTLALTDLRGGPTVTYEHVRGFRRP
jgi:hypothetical protein